MLGRIALSVRCPVLDFQTAYAWCWTHSLQVRCSESISSLFDIEFTITDKGVQRRARTKKEFENLSSTGLNCVIRNVLSVTLISMLRGKQDIAIHLPLDEQGQLDPNNTITLFSMLNANNCVVLSAIPSPAAEIMHMFQRHYMLTRSGVRDVAIRRPVYLDLIEDENQKAVQQLTINAVL